MSSKGKSPAATGGEIALVPKLRFPEFREAGGWEPTTIGALGRFYYGKSAPKWSLAEDAATPCVRYGELYTKFGSVITETYSRTNIAPERLRFSKGGEILIPRVGEKPEDFGKCCAFLPLSGIAIGEMISVLETTQHPLFYTHYFRNNYKQFASVVEGQNVKNLYFTELEPLPIHRPSLPEQQKIAECLDSVDTLIAAQGRKIEVLSTHKNGLMQQLFPHEGEAQPRLRFPEFEGAGEWEEGTLSAIGTVLQGYGFPERYQGLQSGDFPFYKVSDISKSLSTGKTFIEEAANYVNESHLKELKARTIPAGTTVFAKIGEAIRSNRRAITTAPCLIDNNTAGVKSIKGRAIDFFIYLTMEQLSLIDHAGGVVPAVNKSAIEAIPVRFPKIAEQQRIANCLASLDDLIAAENRNLNTLKIHKKGLMQHILPQIGKIDP